MPLERLRSAVAEGIRVYEAGRSRIESRPEVLDREPVFAGTRIPLAHVAGLLTKDVPIEELKEDFPRLSDDDIAYARQVSRMKRDPGRPRKRVTLLRNGEPVPTADQQAGARAAASR